MKKWLIFLALCAGLTEVKAQTAEAEIADGRYQMSDARCLTYDVGWLMEVSSRAGVLLSSRAESRDLSTSVEMTGSALVGMTSSTSVEMTSSALVEMASESVVVKEGHDWTRFVLNTAVSVGVAFGTKTILKSIIHEDRPDHSDNKSFPSGHTAIAFAAARSLDKEFRRESIWIPIVGYAAATAIGVERVVSDRHHWYDVAAGAAIGFGAAELTWWVSDKLFGKDRRVAVGYSGNTVDLVYNF